MKTTPFKLNVPTDEENSAALESFFARQKEVNRRRETFAQAARPALGRLVECCLGKTGQSYKLRALLYSLWNGQPADLSDVLNLDFNLREDFCAVLLAFGFEPFGKVGDPFFYDAISKAFKDAGLYEWFLEATSVAANT